MLTWTFPTLAILALRAFSGVYAADTPIEEKAGAEDATAPSLKVDIATSFPEAEIFGVKLVNGHATKALLSITNDEAVPITVEMVGASLFSLQNSQAVRNFTITRYGLQVPAGGKQDVTYSFATELHPQDFRLAIQAIFRDDKSNFYTMTAYNETVSVVEAPVSIFDPQIIFLYLILAAGFGGVCYFIYNTWITTLFPQQKKRSGKTGDRSKSGSRPRKSEGGEQPSSPGLEGPAITTGSKTYDESWIPAQHLQRPEAKRVRSGTPKTKARA